VRLGRSALQLLLTLTARPSLCPAARGLRKSIGFVADERRINVGLTRARASMIIIGDARSLQIDARWANLIRHCMSGGCFYNAQKPFQVG
jgi:senataxin